MTFHGRAAMREDLRSVDPPAIWVRDWVTDLPSRWWFLDHCRRLLHVEAQPILLVLCDLDLFHVVNAAFGLAVGDEILAAVAHDLRLLAGERGVVARFGGDSFAFVAAGADATAGWIERIETTIRRIVRRQEREILLTASIGVAHHVEPPGSVPELLRDAEVALFEAKQTGGRTVVFDPDRHASHLARIDLASNLADAVRFAQLVLHYQPVHHLESGRIAGFEALLRWNHPRLGLLTPERFLSVVESPTSAWDVDRVVIATACGVLHQWCHDVRFSGVPQVSVNLSSVGVSDPRLVGWVDLCARELALDLELLQVEVTERVAVDAQACRNLAELRERGVQVLLDDFGTGWSGIERLSSIPLDALKIDRSLISGDSGKGLAQAPSVAAAAALGNELGLRVIAEGIETRSQLVGAQLLGCQYGQGFYFAHPLPQSEAEGLMPRARLLQAC